MVKVNSIIVMKILERVEKPLLVRLRVLITFELGFRMEVFLLGSLGMVSELGFPVCQSLIAPCNKVER